MDWRCEWCGKPHEANDPPCDNCGHGSFEKAVVRQPGEAADPDSTTVWVCTECGRTHAKHSPPCSRCGNHELVRERQRVHDDELAAPSYLDLLTPRYALGLLAVLALGAVFVLGLTGTIALPGFGADVPTIEDVPGEGETVDGLALSTVEDEYVSGLNERRRGAGGANLTRDDALDDAAQFLTHRSMIDRYTDRTPPDVAGIRDALTTACADAERVEPAFVTLDGANRTEPFASERALADALLDERFRGSEPDGDERSVTGVDVHVSPDGTVVLAQLSC